MLLLTKELEKKFEKQGDTSMNELEDTKVIAKFFITGSNWTWFAFDYNPETKMFFGCVHGVEKELGYFSLAELKEVKGAFGLGIERDRYFSGEPAINHKHY
jgi:hypothetical protein